MQNQAQRPRKPSALGKPSRLAALPAGRPVTATRVGEGRLRGQSPQAHTPFLAFAFFVSCLKFTLFSA